MKTSAAVVHSDLPAPQLQPLPYHAALRDFLKAEEAEVWNWYASHKVQADQAEAVRFELLKSTYRIERATQPTLYAAAEEVASRLSLNVPITLYQAQNPQGANASLAYLPNEAHIVFHGALTTKLSEQELRALLAHELSHLLLWHGWGGEFFIADQLLSALTHDPRAHEAHYASARLFWLYREIFCDRGSLLVVQDPHVVVSTLVKIETGLETISAESYIRQAEEILARAAKPSGEVTHPETFIRARAVSLWHEGGADSAQAIADMIEGPLGLDTLDLMGQRRVSALTRRMIDDFLAPSWIQTEPMLAHARLFFEDYAPPSADRPDAALAGDIQTQDAALVHYYCYLLMDFVTADRELDELPLAAALMTAEKLGWKSPFLEAVRKELRLTKKQLDKIDKQKETMLAEAAKAVESAKP